MAKEMAPYIFKNVFVKPAICVALAENNIGFVSLNSCQSAGLLYFWQKKKRYKISRKVIKTCQTENENGLENDFFLQCFY